MLNLARSGAEEPLLADQQLGLWTLSPFTCAEGQEDPVSCMLPPSRWGASIDAQSWGTKGTG